MEQQRNIRFRLGVAGHHQTAAIGGWQHDIEPLDRRQFLQLRRGA